MFFYNCLATHWKLMVIDIIFLPTSWILGYKYLLFSVCCLAIYNFRFKISVDGKKTHLVKTGCRYFFILCQYIYIHPGVSKWAGTRYFYPPEIVYSTGRNYWTPPKISGGQNHKYDECENSAIDVIINFLWKIFHKPIDHRTCGFDHR
jgi:hypothetical protein